VFALTHGVKLAEYLLAVFFSRDSRYGKLSPVDFFVKGF
jgi:hypothetical protein